MTQNTDFRLPFNSLTNYVPQNLRNPVVEGLISNLFDRFLTHDESVPLYGYVGRKPTFPEDRSPRVPQSSVERDVNSIIPVFNFQLGTERHASTVEDLIRKAEAIGISPGGLQWLYSQGNNFLPPIDLDKFVNFFNYYWVAKAIPAVTTMPWNPTLAPEYYTIAAPKPTDLNKLNVVAATTTNTVLTGSGFNKLKFKATFTSDTAFTISIIGTLGNYTPVQSNFDLTTNNDHFDYHVTSSTQSVKLLEFDITRDEIYDQFGNNIGLSGFVTGDEFTINTDFLTHNYTVTFAGANGVKGKIVLVKAFNEYQVIDGVPLRAGDRVLVKSNSVTDDGIYIVYPGNWVRTPDFDGETRVAGVHVFDKNRGVMYTSVQGEGGFGFQVEPATPGGAQSNTNQWQEGNYWVSREGLSALGLARTNAIQAVRPIIEYASDLQLNSFVKDNQPSDSGTAYKQTKTEFNQLPMFDLFRYNGDHVGLVSSVFYYEEDLTASLDLKLQKRVLKSTNDSADFIFNHGMAAEDGQLLFIKRNGELKSIWHAGYTEPTIVDQIYAGVGNGTLENLEAKGFTQQQMWTLTAISDWTFSIEGSKMPVISAPYDVITVGEPYDNGELAFTIQAGSILFTAGDTFIFRVGNLESSRYVYRDEYDGIFDRFGGPAADPSGKGAWQIPRMFYNNPYNDSRSPIDEGVLYSHFRSILTNQLEGKPINYAFGGSVKLWSEQQTLLASLLMQRDMTPISMIDLAQRQYETGLNTVSDIFQQNIVQFMANHGPVTTYAKLETLLAFVQSIRTQDNDVRTVLYDSTAPLIGFPATLPQLGIGELYEPVIEFDPILGRTILKHHDGHVSFLTENTLTFRQSIFGNQTALTIKRSNGTYTPAVRPANNNAIRPYKGELVQFPNGTLMSFDVTYDTTEAPANPAIGSLWYKRSSNVLTEWDGINWINQADPSVAWVTVNFADTLNSLMLLVETKLFTGINPAIRKYDFSQIMSDPAFQAQLKKELFAYAALNGYDPLGADYVANDPFTWNYSQAFPQNLPLMPSGEVPARWHDLLMQHQGMFNGEVIPTSRPNLEPWKLMGFNNKATWWATLSSAQQLAYASVQPDQISGFSNAGSVKTVQTTEGITPLMGLQAINGAALSQGDRVLLVNELSSLNNGIWIVSTGGWTRALNSSNLNSTVSVSGGNYKGTTWALVETDLYRQVRTWSNKLWADIKVARPGLKLSVDTVTDALLPPYVNSLLEQSENALTTVIPAGASLGYSFGQNSPVETIWERSLEYGYSLARSLFRYDPLAFLGFTWGFNWIEVDGILYDGFDMSMPGHKRFRLHGDPIDLIERVDLQVTGTGTAVVTYTAYDADHHQNFTVTRNGKTIGYANAGAQTTVGGLTFTIKDEGRPFRMGDRFEIVDDVATFVPSTTYKYLGFGQTFTHALRETSIDTESSFAVAAFREWEVNMGYRAGGLVATDDLQIFSKNETLSESSFDLLFKKNQIARNEWVQALRITVTNFGQRVTKEAGFAPLGSGEDWVFRIEGYNPRYTSISFYDMSSTINPIDFHALSKAHTDIMWFQPTQINGVITTDLPMTITGVQNVINFLFGYSRYLELKGWEFNQLSEFNIDAETGRVRNFQLEIEKFIDRCYAGIRGSQGHIINPFIERVWFNQATGLLSEFVDTSLFDITGHPGVFDVVGVKFKKEDLDVIRTNTQSSFGAEAPMFSAHVQLDEFEHLFIFNNYVQQSTRDGLLYDPFSGARVATYKFNGRKQATNTMRPEFGGHFLVSNKVHQNLQASTDNIANLYDANHAFENETTSRHALALLGFNRKKYFDDLDISEKTQFNFWRGLIQAKGTNFSIDAYLNNNRFDDAKIDEYWAYKLAEYGDARPRIFPELKLSVNDSLTQFTRLQFDAPPAKDNPLDGLGFTQIDVIDEARWFSLDDNNQDVKFGAEVVGTFMSTDAVVGETYTLPFVADKLVESADYIQINSTTILSNVDASPTNPLTITGYGPSRPHFNPVKLFNYVDNELVAEIPVWHPAAGQHTPTAMESINIISNINPAKYNYSKQVVNNNTYAPLRPWGVREVGRVWFDTRNLVYLPYYDATIFPNLDERLSRWGTLTDFSTVNVYEWVQSSVPPVEYDALAATQAGDAGLDAQTKAAGQVADKQTYSRQRKWAMRPIAWSFSPVPTDVDWEATPPFPAGSTDAELTLAGGLAILNRGTFADYGITAGMHLGAWDNEISNPKPLSEYLIEDKFTKHMDMSEHLESLFSVRVEALGTSEFTGQLLFHDDGIIASVRTSDDSGNPINWTVDVSLAVTTMDEGFTEYVLVSSGIGSYDLDPAGNATQVPSESEGGGVNWTTNPDVEANVYGATMDDVVAGKTYNVDFPMIGIRVVATVMYDPTGPVPIDELRNTIVAALGDEIVIRDAVAVTMIVEDPIGLPQSLSNTLDDEYTGPGWRVWNVPTQAQLSADGQPPFASWKPYIGDFYDIPGNLTQIQDAVAYAKAPLTLRNDVVVDRYKTTWLEWSVLKNIMLTKTPSEEEEGEVSFEALEIFDPKRVSVYVNGIAQLKAAFTIVGKFLTLTYVSAGFQVIVIIRKYEPTTAELDFDPDIKDDLSFQKQFKQDYEYVSLPVRDREGALSSTVYFFWVKNKTTPAFGKKQSVQAVAQQLREGPSNFLTFQNMQFDSDGDGTETIDPENPLTTGPYRNYRNYRYDAITISGLSYIVTKDDTFKLRFTRNFTLRDDPEELNLKNVHTEWALMRTNQKTRVPETLWNKLTDSVAGVDVAGNNVPAIRRVLYDERNGSQTQFGFGPEQTLAPAGLLKLSIVDSIVNTKLVDDNSSVNVPDYITFLDFDENLFNAPADSQQRVLYWRDKWFKDAADTRKIMTDIWNQGKVSQINEIFFAALNDVLASNYELTDIFKTSRISVYSIKVIAAAPAAPTFE